MVVYSQDGLKRLCTNNSQESQSGETEEDRTIQRLYFRSEALLTVFNLLNFKHVENNQVPTWHCDGGLSCFKKI